MRRSPSRRAEIGVSLFPFLAVLICTMGALIVLLVLVVQQARVQADTISEQRAEQLQEERLAERRRLQQEEEDFRWQQEILAQQRRELADQLGDRRLQLSHLEDHIRRLDQRWRQLQTEVAEMQKLGTAREEDQDEAERELARLRAELEAERAKLDAARQEMARRKRSFTIIAYQGPNGTRRRPIYIECRESGITIQPEGVVLGPQDFAGPLGPGNPLDASLRAIREYWARVEGEAKYGEPYPLLIVRPDGAVAYSMARAAMASWDDEFGYELVGDDLELEFPPSDPQLKRLLLESIQAARQRQALLAAAMPSRFGGVSPEGFRANRYDSGDAGLGDSAEGYGPVGSGGGFAGAGRSATRDQNGGGSSVDRRSTPDGRYPLAGPTPAGGSGRLGGEDGFARGAGSGLGGVTSSGRPGSPHALGGFYGGGGAPYPMQGGSSPGTPGEPGDAGAGTAAPQGTVGSVAEGSNRGDAGGIPGGPAASGAMSGSGSGGTAGGTGGQACDAAAAAGAAGAPSASMQFGAQQSLPQSIARQKGVNWALPNVASGSTGITRPIAVECYADRLVILPDRGDNAEPRVVAVQEPMRGSMQQFVSEVWTHMERWGMAVAGGYWKPVLKVQVAPDAEIRFHQLRALLGDSGIEVERRLDTNPNSATTGNP